MLSHHRGKTFIASPVQDRTFLKVFAAPSVRRGRPEGRTDRWEQPLLPPSPFPLHGVPPPPPHSPHPEFGSTTGTPVSSLSITLYMYIIVLSPRFRRTLWPFHRPGLTQWDDAGCRRDACATGWGWKQFRLTTNLWLLKVKIRTQHSSQNLKGLEMISSCLIRETWPNSLILHQLKRLAVSPQTLTPLLTDQ